MSDTTALASALLQKLAELEQKVIEYRHDMAAEFGRYSDEVLRDVPEDVSVKVQGTIKDALKKFKAIGPAFEGMDSLRGDPVAIPIDPSSQPRRRSLGHGSPPPILPHTSGVPPDHGDGRSPHAREEEFHGLFVPSFMPLINNTQKQNSQDSLSSQGRADSSLTPSGSKVVDSDKISESISSLPEATADRPYQPLRRLTDDAISSSTASEDSVIKTRRSALRRSSSSSVKPQSPRRVRFEVEGGEVLTTASPPQSPKPVERSPILLGYSADSPSDSYSPTYDYEEDDVGLLGSSPPRPKKISSTDRLKALARNSNEDTSQWQVVGDLQDIDDEDDFLMMPGRNGRSSFSENRQEIYSTLPPTFGQPVNQIAEEANEDADDDDDDMLGMPQLQSFRDKKSFSSPPSDTSNSTFSTSKAGSGPWDSVSGTISPPSVQPKIILPSSEKLDDEDLFDYEPDEDDSDPTPRASTPPKYITEEEPAESDKEHQTEPEYEKYVAGVFSTSPAITIQRSTASEPSTPSSRVPMAATVGSYKGRPFIISSIKDEEVQRKAAEMGDFYSFVGSVDGRSGVDESSSYLQRPDLTYFTGTPKSLSERLMLEDLEEKRGSSNAGSDK